MFIVAEKYIFHVSSFQAFFLSFLHEINKFSDWNETWNEKFVYAW